MAGYYRFESTFSVVSGGEAAFSLRDQLPETIEIVGRIPPPIVWEYLKNVRRIPGKTFIVLKIDVPNRQLEYSFFHCILSTLFEIIDYFY